MKYDAECKTCKDQDGNPLQFEYDRSIMDSEKPAPNCPNCNGEAEKIVTLNGGGFILKGGGWFNKGGY